MVEFYGQSFVSRLLLGTARYPSPAKLVEAIRAAETEIVTLSLRREAGGSTAGQQFRAIIRSLNVTVLPNTAGCYSAREAVVTAQMARELFQTDWIKLEVIADSETLRPNLAELVKAAKILGEEGFHVFPYTTEDLGVAESLLEAGCQVLMPWGAPIGTGQGLNNEHGLQEMCNRFDHVPIVVDAGIGLPSHAARAMEIGCAAVLLNTAVARAEDPVAMARAFAGAIQAGRGAHLAGPMEPSERPHPSTDPGGKAFLGHDA